MKKVVKTSLIAIWFLIIAFFSFVLGVQAVNHYNYYLESNNENDVPLPANIKNMALLSDNQLKDLIVNNGDSVAYLEYINRPISSKYNTDLDKLAYSLYMSNKFNNSDASHQVYNLILKWTDYGVLDSLDNDSKMIAKYYLEKTQIAVEQEKMK